MACDEGVYPSSSSSVDAFIYALLVAVALGVLTQLGR
jgi:hypothetical protein